MHATDITDSPSSPPSAAGGEPARCDECGAAVEREQRYCVNCGAHRRTANDPAARYFSQAGARNRSGAAARTGRVREPHRANGLVLALALAVIPVAVGVGVAVGRSSNNGDGKLVQALDHRNATAAAVPAAPAAGSSATQTSTGSAASTHTGTHAAKTTKHHPKAGSQTHKTKHKSTSSQSTKGPSAAQKAGYGSSSSAKTKVGGGGSAAQAKQDAKIVAKEKTAKGTNYLKQLPQQVVVP